MSSLNPSLQSGSRIQHSTETALTKITNDNGLISILILLNLSAGFETVSHYILLTRLAELISLWSLALSWFQSYLSNRKQYVTLKDANSTLAPVNHGVPQGSVLGPLLLTNTKLFATTVSVSTAMLMTLNYTSAPNPPLISCLVHSNQLSTRSKNLDDL